jgi:hypothetical protein
MNWITYFVFDRLAAVSGQGINEQLLTWLTSVVEVFRRKSVCVVESEGNDVDFGILPKGVN